MGLLDLTQQSNEHLELSKKLSQSLVNASYRKQKLDLNKTCQLIGKLCSKLTKEKVYQTIYCYIEQAGSQYSIQIRSLRDLEHKFPKLHKRYQTSQKQESQVDYPEILIGLFEPITLSQATERVITHSGSPIFPDDCDRIRYTKKCIWEFVNFQKMLNQAINNPSSVDLQMNSKTFRLIEFIGRRYTDPIQFCVNWLQQINHILWKVKSYNYDSLYPILGSSPMFESIMKIETEKFCGDVSEWVTAKYYIGKCK